MVTKTDLQKIWFCYDEETEQYTTPVDEAVRFFIAPIELNMQTYGSIATGDIWTIIFNNEIFIVSKHNYNSTEVI